MFKNKSFVDFHKPPEELPYFQGKTEVLNSKKVDGKRYFDCAKNYGMFVKPDMVECGDFPEKDELDFSDDEI